LITQRFASAPQKLKGYAQYVIAKTQLVWINLKTEEEKEKFIFYVFEHDKGYNRIIECIDSWFAGVRPREEDAPDLQRLKQEKGAGGLQKGIGKKAARFC